jgi:hypothetical protein
MCHGEMRSLIDVSELMIRPSRWHKERNCSRCSLNVMGSSLCLLVVIWLPQIGYLICMYPIVRS